MQEFAGDWDKSSRVEGSFAEYTLDGDQRPESDREITLSMTHIWTRLEAQNSHKLPFFATMVLERSLYL